MVIPQLSKLLLGVRFSLPANGKFKKTPSEIRGVFWLRNMISSEDKTLFSFHNINAHYII